MRIEAYRNLTRRCWSLRSGGRVIEHRPRVVLRDCTMRVREGGRQRVIREGHRSVHAWIEGETLDTLPDVYLFEIGYNPWLAATFTVRPGYEPICGARIVLLDEHGKAWAARQGYILIQEDPVPGKIHSRVVDVMFLASTSAKITE